MALETESQGVGYGISSQKTAVGQSSGPAVLAVPGDIVTAQATELSAIERKHRRDSVGHLRARGHIHRVSLDGEVEVGRAATRHIGQIPYLS